MTPRRRAPSCGSPLFFINCLNFSTRHTGLFVSTIRAVFRPIRASCTSLAGFEDKGRTWMFDIKFTNGAIQDLRAFPPAKQRWIVTALELKLEWDAAHESRDRKRLRPQPVAEWAMRLGEVRVFYDV